MDVQFSCLHPLSRLAFSPDWIGDLLFNGIAQQATRTDTAYGMQADGSWAVNDQHTLRFGMQVQEEATPSKTFSDVLPVDAAGNAHHRRAGEHRRHQRRSRAGCMASTCRMSGASCPR